MNAVIDFINTSRDRYIEELKQYLAIPSISALPQHAPDVERAAEWSADEMRRIGLNNVKLVDTPGNPVVYGDWLGAEGAPTILFYGHYDVQPVDPVNLWTTPPFEATVRDGEIYARGGTYACRVEGAPGSEPNNGRTTDSPANPPPTTTTRGRPPSPLTRFPVPDCGSRRRRVDAVRRVIAGSFTRLPWRTLTIDAS